MSTIGTGDLLVNKGERSRRVDVSATLLPKAAGTNGWSTLGVAVMDDADNFWHLALVQGPPDNNGSAGRRFIELCEMRGRCLAVENLEGLSRTHQRTAGTWRCGVPEECFICPDEHQPCSALPNMFHSDFSAWCDYVASRKCAPNRDDPWLFGYFLDNELAWWGRGARDTGLYNAVESLPETHPAREVQLRFLQKHGVAEASPELKLEFLRLAAERYFKMMSAHGSRGTEHCSTVASQRHRRR